MNAYSGLAQIYDELMHAGVDYNSWINFIEKKIDKPKSSILELACGTGNITIELAKKGYKMTGVDISQEMLTVASEKESRFNIKWINQDMLELELKETYDCVICPCDGFNYITEDDELVAVMEKVYSYLNEGGHFIFDISSRHKLATVLGNNTFAESHEDMAYIWENFYDEISGICDFEVTVFTKSQNGFEREVEHHSQKAHEENEVTSMLRRVGFKDITVFGDYDESVDATESSHRLVFSCIK